MNGRTMRSRKKSKDTLKQMKLRIQQSKICGHWESNPKKEIHSITGLPKKDRNISNKQRNPTSMRTGGRKKRKIPERVQGRK